MKLSREKALLASFFLLALCGCENTELPHVFSGNEVPPEVASEPRAVETPPLNAEQNVKWWRLGDVPSKPSDFTSDTVIDQTKQELENDRTDSERLRNAADMPLPNTQP